MKYFYLLCSLILSTSRLSAAPPTVPATNLSFNTIEGGFFNVGWTPGNGTRRIMIVRAGQPVTAIPQNGIDYTENSNFGSGQAILPGQFIVYDNAFTSFFLTGLSPATQYFFAVYEYNGSGPGIEYLVGSFLSDNASTVSAPTIQASGITFSNITATSVQMSCTAGNGGRRLIVAREGSAVNSDPINMQSYSGNSSFSLGAQVGTGNYALYSSSGNFISITNLKAGTVYFFAIYEFNGNNQPVYKFPAAEATITTRTIPTIPSTNIIVTKTDGKELSLNWTNGNGQRRILVARTGGSFIGLPVNGTDYTPNEIFGLGSSLAAGEFVVYSGTGNSAIVRGLDPASTYSFRIFEYDGSGNSTLFLTSLFGSKTAPTATTPTLQAGNVHASNIQATSLNLAWTNGNGRARLVLIRKELAVNVIPQDFTTYLASNDYGAGQQIGTGNYVLSNTPDEFTTVHNLLPNTTYHIAVFEYNGFNQPLYLSPAAVFSVTTSGPVPVKLSQWNGFASNGQVQLGWATSMEENASHFNIQRSRDGLVFTNIGKITARGNSQSPVHYHTIDAQALTGNSFYRLEMVDLDGKSAYSPVINVSISDLPRIKILGNPVADKLVIELPMRNDVTRMEWMIFNSAGQAILKGIAVPGYQVINVSHLPKGIFWLRLTGGKQEPQAFKKQ